MSKIEFLDIFSETVGSKFLSIYFITLGRRRHHMSMVHYHAENRFFAIFLKEPRPTASAFMISVIPTKKFEPIQ